ncbi:hypothetical protein TRVL_00701 [Trypanosoma vivax]|nr:hypothetical protein TRVL_00701 [Trypanosoma vivax]
MSFLLHSPYIRSILFVHVHSRAFLPRRRVAHCRVFVRTCLRGIMLFLRYVFRVTSSTSPHLSFHSSFICRMWICVDFGGNYGGLNCKGDVETACLCVHVQRPFILSSCYSGISGILHSFPPFQDYAYITGAATGSIFVRTHTHTHTPDIDSSANEMQVG